MTLFGGIRSRGQSIDAGDAGLRRVVAVGWDLMQWADKHGVAYLEVFATTRIGPPWCGLKRRTLQREPFREPADLPWVLVLNVASRPKTRVPDRVNGVRVRVERSPSALS